MNNHIKYSSTFSFSDSTNDTTHDKIDWSMQTKVENQTRTICVTSHNKKANIILKENVKRR